MKCRGCRPCSLQPAALRRKGYIKISLLIECDEFSSGLAGVAAGVCEFMCLGVCEVIAAYDYALMQSASNTHQQISLNLINPQ